jgi:hypothetical protein
MMDDPHGSSVNKFQIVVDIRISNDNISIMKNPSKKRPGLLLRMEPALLQKLRDHCDMIGVAYERFARRAVSEAIAREPMLSNGNVTFDNPIGGAIVKPKAEKKAKPAKPRKAASVKKKAA